MFHLGILPFIYNQTNLLKSSVGFKDRDIRERSPNLAIVHGSTTTKKCDHIREPPED